MKQHVTLSIDSDIYKTFSKLMQEKGHNVSNKVEKYMLTINKANSK